MNVSQETKEYPGIELLGVETNNLKAIDARLPIGQITVVTGVSGSGKSSLVFDTLYGESYRRYVESLSSFARQYLKALPKPKIRGVRNLPPAVAVQQSRSGATNRSTVATATELADLLRILFAHLSEVRCRNCGSRVEPETPEIAARKAIAGLPGDKALIVGPLAAWGKVTAKELKAQLSAQGFARLLAGGKVVKLEDAKAADFKDAGVVIDRFELKEDNRGRLTEALQLAFKVGRGRALVMPEADPTRALPFSSGMDCAKCGIEYAAPTEALFSFNHPLGACTECQGFGYTSELDWDKVIPDKSASLADDGVAAWNFGQFAEYYTWAKTSAKREKQPFDRPFKDYDAAQWEWLKNGEGKAFDGILGFFSYLDSKRYKAHYRIHASRFRKYVLCSTCHGGRLNDKALACVIDGKSYAEVSKFSIDAMSGWLLSSCPGSKARRASADGSPTAAVRPGDDGTHGVEEALEEMTARLGYLRKIGVGYLSLERSARTLSGGELQRISMARCLGSALTDTLFCLDEPSAGLHARDSGNLLEIVRELRDQGNTVVLVEHERRLIEGADHLIEIGPKAGHEGGMVTYEGKPTKRPFASLKVTGKHRALKTFIELKGAATHNLKQIDVKFPVGALTAVCGVSGSGKTSLIQHTLYPLVAKALGTPVDRDGGSEPKAASLGPAAALAAHAEVMLVSQAALGRSSRSNIATYLGLMDEIRKLFASEPLAKELKLGPGAFSFNTPTTTAGGRCETCRGLGLVTESLSFLGEMQVVCPDCQGRRFSESVLLITRRGKTLGDVLALTVAEARVFFFDRPAIVKACDEVMGLGMGYLTLGQATSSFSGGEAQRLKLVSLMREARGAKPSLLIFDEPTTGLADSDVAGLIAQLHALADRGHTVIVVEHHLEVLRAADWLVEIGPEAAALGGELVYGGPPDGIGAAPRSVTARYMTDGGGA